MKFFSIIVFNNSKFILCFNLIKDLSQRCLVGYLINELKYSVSSSLLIKLSKTGLLFEPIYSFTEEINVENWSFLTLVIHEPDCWAEHYSLKNTIIVINHNVWYITIFLLENSL